MGAGFREAIPDTHDPTSRVAREAPTEPVIAAMFDHLHGSEVLLCPPQKKNVAADSARSLLLFRH